MKSHSDELAVFVQVVESGSFSRAAERLGLANSAVSRTVKRLEDKLSANLLNRTTRQLRLTEEGCRFFERARQILQDIEAAEKMVDDDIEPCTAEERWADADKYAVMKNGRKTAVRVFDTLIEAENCAGELGNSHYVEHRPAVSRKCGKYCLCKDFCNFYKKEQGAAK